MGNSLLFGLSPGDFDFGTPPPEESYGPNQGLEHAYALRQQMDDLRRILGTGDTPPTPTELPRLPQLGEPDYEAIKSGAEYQNADKFQKDMLIQAEREKSARAVKSMSPLQRAIFTGLEGLSTVISNRGRRRGQPRREVAFPLTLGLQEQQAKRDAEREAIRQRNEQIAQRETELNRQAMDAYHQHQEATLRAILPSLAANVYKQQAQPKPPSEIARAEWLRQQPEFKSLPPEEQSAAIMRLAKVAPSEAHAGLATKKKAADIDALVQKHYIELLKYYRDPDNPDYANSQQKAQELALRDAKAFRESLDSLSAAAEQGPVTGSAQTPNASYDPNAGQPIDWSKVGMPAATMPSPQAAAQPPNLLPNGETPQQRARRGYFAIIKRNPKDRDEALREFIARYGFNPESGQR